MEKVYYNPNYIGEDKGKPGNDSNEKSLEPSEKATTTGNINDQNAVLSGSLQSSENATKKESDMPTKKTWDIIPHKTLNEYLLTFRRATFSENRKAKLSTETVPFDSGAVIRLEFGDNSGDIIHPPVQNVEDVGTRFGIDFNQKLEDLQKKLKENGSSLGGSFVLYGGDIIYLLKGNAKKNWNIESMTQDITIITELVKKFALKANT